MNPTNLNIICTVANLNGFMLRPPHGERQHISSQLKALAFATCASSAATSSGLQLLPFLNKSYRPWFIIATALIWTPVALEAIGLVTRWEENEEGNETTSERISRFINTLNWILATVANAAVYYKKRSFSPLSSTVYCLQTVSGVFNAATSCLEAAERDPLPPNPPNLLRHNTSTFLTFLGNKGEVQLSPQALIPTLANWHDLTEEELHAAARRFDLVFGSITEEKEGVIQDPAGSAVGANALIGGGLSGAIYKKFGEDLQVIPHIEPGASLLNSGEHPNARRILHTYSPHLGSCENLRVAMTRLSDAYLGAIREFVNQSDRHKQNTFNLCAISAAIYGAHFRIIWPEAQGAGHIDPSLTEGALCTAIARYLRENPEGLQNKELRLFYLRNGLGAVFTDTAVRVKAALDGNEA